MGFFSKGLVQIFEDQVERAPQKIAVEHDDQTITYDELNNWSNDIAYRLIDKGSIKGDVIGVCIKQSINFIASILGVLKAGCAYLPLDPELPEDRFNYILADSSAKIIITKEKNNEYFNKNILLMHVSNQEKTSSDISKILVNRNEDDCAYIMYTSGSTGKPKGVMIADRGIIRLVVNPNYMVISEEDKFAQLSSLSFDASTFEIWGALLNGASISIIAKNNFLDPVVFDDLIRKHNITTMWITTSLLNFITSQLPGAFSNIKYLLFGGEKVTPHFIKEIIKHGKPKHLLHAYGPTENTTFSTCYEVNNLNEITETIPIGKAISNSVCYVISEDGKLVDAGNKGELYVGGLGIAIGYHNLPELNKQKFVRNIYDRNGPIYLYKTGDIVRLLPSGDIEYIARTDELLKIRGYLVELNEIRSIISGYPLISEVFITTINNPDEYLSIVAFICPKNGIEINIPELQKYMHKQLPNYMIPSHIKVIDKMPITENGKVNKKTLLNSLDIRSTLQISDSSKDQPIEIKILKIWRDILKQPLLKKEDNFFHFGGHSFIAYKAITNINEILFLNLKLHNMFEYPTVEALCGYINSTHNTREQLSSTPNITSINGNGNRAPIYIIPPFEFLHTLLEFARKFEPEQPVYAFDPDYINNSNTTNYSFEDIARIYVEDLIKITKEGPVLLCGWSLGGAIAFEMARQLIELQRYHVKLVILDTDELEYSSNNYHIINPVLIVILNIVLSVDAVYFFFCNKPYEFAKIIIKTLYDRFLLLFDPNHEVESKLRPVFISQMNAFINYRPKPINCDVTNIISRYRYRTPYERNKGCRLLCLGKYKEEIIDGTHNSILKEPLVTVITNKIKSILDKM